MGQFFVSIFLLVILVQSCRGCNTKITNNEEELGVFAKCQNKWCLQKGLQKPQYTKCESVVNKGKTCINPEVKNVAATGGLPIEYSLNDYEKWCEQLGGFYADHCIGKRTGYMVWGCAEKFRTGYDWHWCFHIPHWFHAGTYNYFITSITCTGEYSLFA